MPMTSVQVLPGPGIVARFGEVLLWLEEGEGGGRAVTAELLSLARALAVEGDGHEAGPRVAELLRSDPQAVPAMVLVAPTGDGLQVVVHGWGRLLADGIDIDGGWVDRELPAPTALAAGRGGDLLRVPVPESVLDLRRGSTPGGGAAVLFAARPPAAPAPERLDADGPNVVEAGAAPAEAPAGERSGVTVKGVTCSHGHFNNPIAVVCATCGNGMGGVSRILQDGIRPPLGALVLDDGTSVRLDTDLLVGSAPQAEAAATGTGERTVVVADPHAAPVHVAVRLVGWDVVLVPRAPTFVLAPGSQQWSPAPIGQPTPLAAGSRVAVGQRTFAVESAAPSS